MNPKSILSAFAIFFLSANLRSEDQFNKLYSLSEDMRDVILKSPEGHPMANRQFQLNTTQSDLIKSLADVDDQMRIHIENSKFTKDCDHHSTPAVSTLEKRIDKREFQLETVVFASDKKFEQNALGRFTSDDYISYMGQLYSSGNSKAYGVYSVQMLTNKYKLDNPNSGFDQLTFSEKEKTLNSYAEKYLGAKLPSGLLMKEMAFQNMVDHSSDWQKTLAAAKDSLTTEQKVQLVSKLGGYFGNYYNFDRRDAGESARGTYVTTEQLLTSVKNGTPGGICRDIALAQTQILKELGFSKNYVVAYKTLEGSHATALTIDPVTGKIIKFNYSETTEAKKGSGTEALIQDTSLPDHGLGFRIYDSNGKPVTHVPSEMSLMMRDSTGFEFNREFNQKNYSLTSVGFSSDKVNGNLFTGRTSSGENIYGVALFKNVQYGPHITLGTGVAVSKLEGQRSLMTIDQENLYLRSNLELTSPSWKLGNFETKGIAGGSFETLISNNKETYKGSSYVNEAKKELDATADMHLGVQNNYVSNDQKTKVESVVYANFYPDWNHVASGDKTVPVYDGLVVRSGISHNIADDKKIMIDTAVVMKNYGTNLVMKASYSDNKENIRYVAGLSAPLSRDMPTFLPGGERRLFLGAEKANKNMIFSIEYEKNFDNNAQSVMLKAKMAL